MSTISLIETDNVPHCKHFVTRKKRYCRMTLKKDQEYCGEHMPAAADSTTNSNLRIVCPLDNKHTCFVHKLAKHLKICNARQVTNVPYILKGVNCGEVLPSRPTGTTLNSRLLVNVPVLQIKNLVARINKLHDGICKTIIREIILKHDVVEEELSKSEYGSKTKKHLHQTSSILGILREYNLLQSETCFVEFGAGKGQLSYWISKATENVNGSSVLLVERASLRHKLDNKLDKTKGQVHRIRADIADLVLHKVNALSNAKYVVGVTKHLCGDATDLALRCLQHFQEQSTYIVSGIVMAFCCHHRCQWSSYTGKQFFEENELSDEDFDIMCGMVSWATCGTGFSRDKNNENSHTGNNAAVINNRDQEIGLSREEKEHIGRKCKFILNYGRMLFLRNQGFESELCYYVKPDVSLENLCIVAYKENIFINK